MHSVDALSNRYEEQVELKNAHEAMKYLSDTELSDNTVLVIYLAPTDDDETRDKSLSRNGQFVDSNTCLDMISIDSCVVHELCGGTTHFRLSEKRVKAKGETATTQGFLRFLLMM